MPDTAPGNPAAKYHCAALPVNITCADCHHCQRGNAVLGYTGFRIINFTRLAGPGKPEPALPFVLEQTEVFGGCASSMWAFVRYSKGSLPEDKVRKLDIDLCAEDGEVCVRMKGLTLRVQASERVIDGMFIFFQVPNLYIT
ncbi:MAG: hypothetical protein GY820_42390 [Gammaproteobacteria bacterium]|nr:hypothetical protein [Gammaproteobacteria bacterium]